MYSSKVILSDYISSTEIVVNFRKLIAYLFVVGSQGGFTGTDEPVWVVKYVK